MPIGRAKNGSFHKPVMKPRQKNVMKATKRGGSSFGDGLAAAASSIIADGRRALTDPELSGPEAVHEVRKALKRWRALLRLLGRPLGEQADQMRSEARELMRGIAGAPDAQSAPDALRGVGRARHAALPTRPSMPCRICAGPTCLCRRRRLKQSARA